MLYERTTRAYLLCWFLPKCLALCEFVSPHPSISNIKPIYPPRHGEDSMHIERFERSYKYLSLRSGCCAAQPRVARDIGKRAIAA